MEGGKEKQIELIATNEIQMLGVPLGSDEKVAAYVEKKLLHRLKAMVERLADFDDIQSAFYLLRVSFSIVRATHFMRTNAPGKVDCRSQEVRSADVGWRSEHLGIAVA